MASATAPEEKASLDKVLEARKAVLAATAKTWDLKGAGDAVATQRYADEDFAPLVTKYLKAQDDFVTTLEKRRDVIRAEATQRRIEYAITGIISSMVLMAAGLFLAWKLARSITLPLNEAVETIDAIAAGDLTRELQSTRKDEFGHMLRSLSAMSARLRGVVSEVRQGVDSVSSASVEIANGNHDLSARTEQTASNLEETAASMEQLTATVSQSADTARQANQLAGTAAQAATRGGEVVDGRPAGVFPDAQLCRDWRGHDAGHDLRLSGDPVRADHEIHRLWQAHLCHRLERGRRADVGHQCRRA